MATTSRIGQVRIGSEHPPVWISPSLALVGLRPAHTARRPAVDCRTGNEWELAAAADESQPDARGDPRWRARILDWYGQPANHPLAAVGLGPANFYGVQDLHGLVWEWVDDFNALIVSGDSRDQGDPDKLKFCGAGALSLQDRDNYAVLMRIAFLSALQARSTAHSLGFRCTDAEPQ